jgi:glycosyltransferase involved in cell wall biosynthesis
MYLIPITVPIYCEGGRNLIASDWFRALELLRDSLEGRYGHLCVAAPWLPLADSEQVAREPHIKHDGIELMPLFDNRVRMRGYWAGVHRQVVSKMKARFDQVRVMHGTVEESLRPYCYATFMGAAAKGIPSVFVQDQDVAAVIRELHRGDSLKMRAVAELSALTHEYQCRRAITVAGVSFLKGRTTMQRYRKYSADIYQIDDTSYLSSEIVDRGVVDQRLASLLNTERPLRFVFCGRLVHIKGVDRSLRIVHMARAAGARVTLDIIGGGPQESELREQARQLGLGEEVVRFFGAMDYGPDLLQRLALCDAMLFNPRMQETPRMIFDGYASGLPMVAGDIEYVRERIYNDAAGIELPRDDEIEAASRIVALDRDRSSLVPLTHAALRAAAHHAADAWYARRASWTHEMVERYERQGRAAR